MNVKNEKTSLKNIKSCFKALCYSCTLAPYWILVDNMELHWIWAHKWGSGKIIFCLQNNYNWATWYTQSSSNYFNIVKKYDLLRRHCIFCCKILQFALIIWQHCNCGVWLTCNYRLQKKMKLRNMHSEEGLG